MEAIGNTLLTLLIWAAAVAPGFATLYCFDRLMCHFSPWRPD